MVPFRGDCCCQMLEPEKMEERKILFREWSFLECAATRQSTANHPWVLRTASAMDSRPVVSRRSEISRCQISLRRSFSLPRRNPRVPSSRLAEWVAVGFVPKRLPPVAANATAALATGAVAASSSATNSTMESAAENGIMPLFASLSKAAPVRLLSAVTATTAADSAALTAAAAAGPGADAVIARGLTDVDYRRMFGDVPKSTALRFRSLPPGAESFGGFESGAEQARFEDDLRWITSIWCCTNKRWGEAEGVLGLRDGGPGHIMCERETGGSASYGQTFACCGISRQLSDHAFPPQHTAAAAGRAGTTCSGTCCRTRTVLGGSSRQSTSSTLGLR